jgi:hypothetical protein
MRVGATWRFYLARHADFADAVVPVLAFGGEALEPAAGGVTDLWRGHRARTALSTASAFVFWITRKLVRAQRMRTAPVTTVLMTVDSHNTIFTSRGASFVARAATTGDCRACVVLTLTSDAIPATTQELTHLEIVDNLTEVFVLIELTRHAARTATSRKITRVRSP